MKYKLLYTQIFWTDIHIFQIFHKHESTHKVCWCVEKKLVFWRYNHIFLTKNKPFKVGSEKNSKYGKVLYQHYFQYILCVNLFIIKMYLKKIRNLKNYFVRGVKLLILFNFLCASLFFLCVKIIFSYNHHFFPYPIIFKS